MFFHKSLPVLSILFFFSCRNQKAKQFVDLTDTVKVKLWKKNYDSIYTEYKSSKKLDLLRTAAPFADSILYNKSLLQKDSFYRDIYCSVAFYRAVNLNDLHDFVKSRELLANYILLYKDYTLSEEKRLAYAHFTIGNIYSRFGEYKNAMLSFNPALTYYTAIKDTEKISSCLLNLSVPLKELGQYAEATQILQQILLLTPVSAKRKAKACIELADIYIRQHEIPETGLQIQKARGFLTGVSYDIGITETYEDLFNVEGDLYMASNNPLKALIAYRQSLDSAKKASSQNLRDREIGKIDIAIGKALDKLNNKDSALQYYNKGLYTVIDIDTGSTFALPQQKDIYAENTIAEALYARADCVNQYQTENDSALANAVSCYQLAFATESKLLNAFSYDDSRLFMIAATRKQTEKAIGICYRLYKKTNNIHWANEAFLFAEHNKAFVLQEAVRRNTAASIYLNTDSSYEKMQQLQNSLAVATIELNKQNFASLKDTALLRSLTAAKQKNEEALMAAENDVRIKHPQYTNWLNEETALSAEELIDKTISTATGLVEYFSGDSSLYAFSASKNKAFNFYKLNDSVKTIAVDFLNFFSSQDLILNKPVQYADAAWHLYQALLGPYLPNGNLATLIIPDGFIAHIPFDALLTSNSTSGNIASFPFLIKQQQTYYAFSCKTLMAQSQNNNNTTVNSIAAFAPVFSNRERGLSSLTHSNEELEAIKQYYPEGKFYTGNNAILKEFENNCNNNAIIHLATHANPGNDSLPARIELFDSSVYIDLIYAKKINARLVVLSGCETGTGTLNSSEGLMSLARGFSYAGTKNVIASLWQTEDNSSAKIFKDFYSNLSNSNFSSALHHSKLSLLNNGAVASASPYYWAGYIYIGSPEESLPPQSTGKLKWVTVIIGSVITTAYFLFVRRRRKTNRVIFQARL